MAENSELRQNVRNIYSNIPSKYNAETPASSSSATEETNVTSTYGRIIPKPSGTIQGNSFAYCCGESNKLVHSNINFPWDISQGAGSCVLPQQNDMTAVKVTGSQNSYSKFEQTFSNTAYSVKNVKQTSEQHSTGFTSELNSDAENPVYENIRDLQTPENQIKTSTCQKNIKPSFQNIKPVTTQKPDYNSILMPASCTVVNSPIYANLHEVKNGDQQSHSQISKSTIPDKTGISDVANRCPMPNSAASSMSTSNQHFVGFHVSDSTPVNNFGNSVVKDEASETPGMDEKIDEVSERMTCLSVKKEKKKVSFSTVGLEDSEESDEDDENSSQNTVVSDTSSNTKPINYYKDDYKPNTLNSKLYFLIILLLHEEKNQLKQKRKLKL
ncbi:LIM domain-containing protein jub [Caerostris extrusa]|uniref:LIM domain-containing protein jub n=1 Tax=Caerostris extrusa TaxID=172846 RepID=A0AAV4MNI5_CAEEX|nr:LIM domain-containing protein jub [Caerostris extrusa]